MIIISIHSKFSWNEFKVTNWRKIEYGKHMIKLTQLCLTNDFSIESNKLSPEDQLLLRHIVEANDIADLQK